MLTATPAQLARIARYVESEYGTTGYRVGIVDSAYMFVVFRIRHTDDSTFKVVVDRHENLTVVGDRETHRQAAARLHRENEAALEEFWRKMSKDDPDAPKEVTS